MKQAIWFLAGMALGFGGGYLLRGKKEKKKDAAEVVTYKSYQRYEDGKAKETYETDTDDGEEVNTVVRNAGYVVAEELDDNFDDDFEDLDDYIATIDGPSDDDEPAPRAFEMIGDDDYYTSKSDFDKIRLHLDMSAETLMDELGNDLADLFARNGISLGQLYSESHAGRDLVYYRCWRMDSDYEIIVDERGESE